MFDVCVRLFCVYVVLCLGRGLITRPMNPTVCKVIMKLRNQQYAPKWEQEGGGGGERERKYHIYDMNKI
jgi:hypothetical protein